MKNFVKFLTVKSGNCMTIIKVSKYFVILLIGQIISIVIGLIFIRTLTGYLSPKSFGEFMLVINIIPWLLAVTIEPFLQAIMKFFSENREKRSFLKNIYALKNIVLTITFFIILTIGSMYLYFYREENIFLSILFGVGLSVLFSAEIIKNFWVSIFNIEENYTKISIMGTIDLLLKTLFSILFLLIYAKSFISVFFGYAFGSFLFLISICFYIRKNYNFLLYNDYKKEKNSIKFMKIIKFALPLIPASFFFWANSIADRYLVAFFLGVEKAGIYIAIYSIASRPFLLLSRIFEMIFRPIIYKKVEKDNTINFSRYFVLIILLVIFDIIIYLFHHELASIFLGKKFRKFSYLMIWIAIGYNSFVLVRVFSLFLYALHRTKEIFYIEIIGFFVMLVSFYILVKKMDILGASIANIVYFSFQLFLLLFILVKIRKKGG